MAIKKTTDNQNAVTIGADTDPFTQNETVGIGPLVINVPAPVISELPRYNAWHLFGAEVLKPLLQNSLALVFEDCFIGKFAYGDFQGFWKASLGAGNMAIKIAKDLEGRDRIRVNAVGKALLGLYANGLDEDSMLLCFTACKGQLMPSQELEDQFNAACKQKRAEFQSANLGDVSIIELRQRFEDGSYAAHQDVMAAQKAKGQAWYQTKLAAEQTNA